MRWHFCRNFPFIQTQAACLWLFFPLLQRIPSFFPRFSPGRRFLTLQTAAHAQISAYKVCVIESCYKPRHVTRVSVLGKPRQLSQKIKIRGSWPRKIFFKGRTHNLSLWMWRWLTVSSCKECKRFLILFWRGKYFKTLHFSKKLLLALNIYEYEYLSFLREPSKSRSNYPPWLIRLVWVSLETWPR